MELHHSATSYCIVVYLIFICKSADLYFYKPLGDLESELLICCETTSERPLGLWGQLTGAEKMHYTAALVTPRWLLWATSGEKRQTAVLSAHLREIEVKEFDSKLVEDHGLEIHGFLHGASEKSLVFIGLGHEPAAEKFKQVLKQAVAQANQ